MILYNYLYSQFKFFMRMFFKPQIVFFMVLLSFAETGAFEKKEDFLLEAGYTISCRMEFLRCEGKGGCDTTKPNNPAPINYKQRSTVYSVEYFFSKPVLRVLKPYIGFNGTNKDAYYGYFGFSADLFFRKCKCFIITPTLAVGWYVDGNEIKLGNRVQFRSGGDIYYKFKNNVRVGVGLYHISNAGLGEQNPGAEQAILKYQIPF